MRISLTSQRASRANGFLKHPTPSRRSSQRPVSYTHLDVYKRQVDTLTEELERIISKKKDELTGALYITPSDSKGVGQSEFAEKCEMNKPRNLVKNLPKTQDILAKVSSSTELNLDDDDEVVLESELTPEEASIKERIWTGLNHDFMVAQERKRLKQEADELTGNTSGTTRKKRARTAPEVVQEYGVKDALSVIGVDERTCLLYTSRCV